MEPWNIQTYVKIKQAIATGRKVTVILHENIASFGRVTADNAHCITDIKTGRNPQELEAELDNRGTYIPISELDVLMIKD